ncbi:TLC domain-containing protein [Mycena indigotica]|uniref:TLC domain-containing protein n=1 Tax=Mycena indigotica TaxID=2126181 RepID=A0A8H6W747_9AGAR|nr:TLC domain-containing protein [Mycena indigotica]KAF7301749.1 TLC domain-containing protein [Mycena indigotica]
MDKKRAPPNISTDAATEHAASDGVQPQTPLTSGSSTPTRSLSPQRWTPPKVQPWLRWVIEPLEAFKLLLIPVVLYLNWELLTPRLQTIIEPWSSTLGPYLPDGQLPNPFAPLFLLSNPVASSPPDDPRYAKSYLDLVFIAYYVVFFSCFRQLVTVNLFRRVGHAYGINKEGKLDRLGEQGYAVVYFLLSSLWGIRVMYSLPIWWYQTKYFWLGYPHWDMTPELKRYYLMQMAYWCQQFIVLVLRLEKPRKDYNELIAHHIVTLWLVGWSYLVNLTLIGNAVYLSMDLPDTCLAFSKVLNYLRFERAKVFSFLIFTVVWAYFRHYLNFVILWSVWTEFDLIPEQSKRWFRPDGVWLVGWMRYQVFIPLVLLQLLNLFWFYLILRILLRTILTATTDDDRSDDEEEEEQKAEPPTEKSVPKQSGRIKSSKASNGKPKKS